jgi:TetR/AcrR family transcriptional regulator, transcriptional repressor for nem operon
MRRQGNLCSDLFSLRQTEWSVILAAMSRDPSATRTRILDAAEEEILRRGFGGATVEGIIAAAGVTKGAFFHHFESKAALGRALVERYAENDAAQMESVLEDAERLSDDPLEQVLIAVGLVEEEMGALTEPFRGCLIASYCYQAQLFDDETLVVGRSALGRWRERLAEKLRLAAALHPPRAEFDPETLADAFTTVLEGAFVLSKVYGRAEVVSQQLTHYHAYLELLFGVER